jgi:hypothetical protein
MLGSWLYIPEIDMREEKWQGWIAIQHAVLERVWRELP